MDNQIGTLISKSKKFYYSLGTVDSTCLKQRVVFNRYGWKHLLYDSSDRRRTNKDIELRLFLLREAKAILENSQHPVVITEKVSHPPSIQVKYFEVYGKSTRTHRYIKVIVRRINEGNYHFFSIRRSKRNKKPV